MGNPSSPAALILRLRNASRELALFAVTTFTLGMAGSIVDSVLNNYLNERFVLDGFQRSFLEFPRELPGFLVVFVSALLWFLCSRRLGTVALVLQFIGVILIGFITSSYGIMVICLFVYSMGQHMFLPLTSAIGMELSTDGKTGRRLGQLNALRNLATICGSFLVFLGFKYLNFTFQTAFVLAAIGFGIAAILMSMMTPQKAQPKAFLKLHKEYKLYYWLSILFGSRKQLFITFGPWVIVTIFQQPTQTLATLLTIGGVIGILFQPLLGWAIDKLGERTVLASEAVLLVFVCAGYGLARFIFTEQVAFYVTCGCYLLDQMLLSVSMARSTYMKKIAKQPADVQPALTAAVTIDHIFSIAIALLGGVIWKQFGYQYVFLMGAGIAVINFFSALRVRIPAPVAGIPAEPEALLPGAK